MPALDRQFYTRSRSSVQGILSQVFPRERPGGCIALLDTMQKKWAAQSIVLTRRGRVVTTVCPPSGIIAWPNHLSCQRLFVIVLPGLTLAGYWATTIIVACAEDKPHPDGNAISRPKCRTMRVPSPMASVINALCRSVRIETILPRAVAAAPRHGGRQKSGLDKAGPLPQQPPMQEELQVLPRCAR